MEKAMCYQLVDLAKIRMNEVQIETTIMEAFPDTIHL